MLVNPCTLLYSRSVAQWLESLAFHGGVVGSKPGEGNTPPIFLILFVWG